MAELFGWFEVVKPSFVKPRMLNDEGTGKVLNSANMKTFIVAIANAMLRKR